MTMTVAGTPSFMAPEVLRQERYGSEADVWSFGGMLVQMATRKPYQALLDESAGLPVYVIMQRVAQGELRPTHGVAENTEWPPEVERIATACVAADRDERPNFQTIVRELDALSRAHHRLDGVAGDAPARLTDSFSAADAAKVRLGWALVGRRPDRRRNRRARTPRRRPPRPDRRRRVPAIGAPASSRPRRSGQDRSPRAHPGPTRGPLRRRARGPARRARARRAPCARRRARAARPASAPRRLGQDGAHAAAVPAAARARVARRRRQRRRRTREDAEFLTRNGALPAERIRAVGGRAASTRRAATSRTANLAALAAARLAAGASPPTARASALASRAATTSRPTSRRPPLLGA